MRAPSLAILGITLFLVAGFLRGAAANSPDPEVVLAGSYAVMACGLLGVLVGGVAMGIRLSRN